MVILYLIKTIHKTNADFKGIIVIKAGKPDKDHYNATGRVDFTLQGFYAGYQYDCERWGLFGSVFEGKESSRIRLVSLYMAD